MSFDKKYAAINALLFAMDDRSHQCVLFASDIGAHAYGFANDRSDRVVRYIYSDTTDSSRALDRTPSQRDHNLNCGIDMVGWSLDETLRRLHRSDFELFTAIQSSVKYRTSIEFQQLASIASTYFDVRVLVQHCVIELCQYIDMIKAHKMTPKIYLRAVWLTLVASVMVDIKQPRVMSLECLLDNIVDNNLRAVMDGFVVDVACGLGDWVQIGSTVVDTWLIDSASRLRREVLALPKRIVPFDHTNEYGWLPLEQLFADIRGKNIKN